MRAWPRHRLLAALAVLLLHAGLGALVLRAGPLAAPGPARAAPLRVSLRSLPAPLPASPPLPQALAPAPVAQALSSGRPQGAVASAAAPPPAAPTAAGGGVEPEAAAAAPVEPAAPALAPALPPAAAPSAERWEPARRAACAPAPHPPLLRERGIEGVVRLRVWVDELGRAGEVLLAASSGFRLFDEAALAQVRRCPFEPARRGQTPQPSWVEFAVRFALRPGETSHE